MCISWCVKFNPHATFLYYEFFTRCLIHHIWKWRCVEHPVLRWMSQVKK